MEYRGTFEDGVVRPDRPLDLPNGTPVEFHPLDERARKNGAAGTRQTPPDELERLDRRARQGRTLDEILAEQRAQPIRSIEDLAVDGLENEDVDAFIRSVKEGRR